jgi:hypothetical protein
MPNHYHILLETPKANLSAGMQQLNSIYSQAYNRRHKLVGHLFQGRYKAILCEKESYLLELSRYIVLNPVRAKLVLTVGEWNWSSFRIALGDVPTPPWFQAAFLLSHFGPDIESARRAYTDFVNAGLNVTRPLDDVQHQLVLGEVSFDNKAPQCNDVAHLRGVSRTQRKAIIQPLEAFFQATQDRDRAIANAYASGGFSMGEIAHHVGLSTKTVSRAVRKCEGAPTGPH